jgi:hypothetical protein
VKLTNQTNQTNQQMRYKKMTHAHDRTMLANLGFADPDKQEPLHDLACRYLMEPEQSGAILMSLGINSDVLYKYQEYTISKGEGQYRTTIGFMDVLFRCRPWDSNVEMGAFLPWYVSVEVKIQPIETSAILRQLNLYMDYFGEPKCTKWVVVTDFDMSQSSVNMLKQHRIHTVRLGKKFREWAQSADVTKSADIKEI